MAAGAPMAEAISAWCAEQLGSRPRGVLFESVHLSRVIGYQLADDRRVVIKARPRSDRLLDCVVVQRHLYASGFPCPRPLTDPMLLGGWMVGAEEYVPNGVQLTDAADMPAPFARALAQLVTLAPPAEQVPRLAQPMPWVGWNHHESGTWPTPDDLDIDLNDHRGPAWLDDIAERIRERMRRDQDRLVVGHGDWESPNLRWIGRTLHCVHDWDSCVSQTEPAIAGAAAAVYTATGAPFTNHSVDQAEKFLVEYQAARGVAWETEQVEVAWAAGLWVCAFNAKKAIVAGRGDGSAEQLRQELAQRLSRAGA